jgi:hypothetical protein
MADEYTKQRYVGIFDILGFKERVRNNTHEFIYYELNDLKSELEKRVANFKRINKAHEEGGFRWKFDETAHILFSDTIVFITENAEIDAYWSIKAESNFLIKKCIEKLIPIKGCIAKGEVSYNEKKQILFGTPIIDAYLLSEEMKFMGVLVDKSMENDIKERNVKEDRMLDRTILHKAVPLKKGNENNYVLNLKSDDKLDFEIKNNVLINSIIKMLREVKGSPRKYYTNTLELFWTKDEIDFYAHG